MAIAYRTFKKHTLNRTFIVYPKNSLLGVESELAARIHLSYVSGLLTP